MLRSNWGIILALVGWLVLAGNAPQPKATPERGHSTNQIADPAPRGRPVPVEVVNQPVEPSGYQEPCRYDQSDSRSDLCAQWTAARAASDAAYYARLQLWGAGAGIIGLLVTIWLTRRAVKAAQASVTVAQDTAKQQLRAYIGIKKSGTFPMSSEEGRKGRAKFILRNFGQTPATDVTAIIGFGWSPYLKEKGTKPPIAWHYDNEVHPFALAPGGEIHHSSEIPTALTKHGDGIVAGNKALWVELVIAYRDIYLARHIQRVTFYVRGARYKAGGLHVAEHAPEISEEA